MVAVELTEREAQVAGALFDIALKAVGTDAAEAALVLTRKINAARIAAKASDDTGQ